MTTIEVWTRPMEDVDRLPEETRWHRVGIWEDGKMIKGDLVTFPDESVEEFIQSHSNRSETAIPADDRPELFQQRVEDGLVHAEDVYEEFGRP
jgi:hypothetical protein